jgi:hypothetical protein
MTDEFTRRVFRIILANATQSREFTGICKTTLEILLDVVIDGFGIPFEAEIVLFRPRGSLEPARTENVVPLVAYDTENTM